MIRVSVPVVVIHAAVPVVLPVAQMAASVFGYLAPEVGVTVVQGRSDGSSRLLRMARLQFAEPKAGLREATQLIVFCLRVNTTYVVWVHRNDGPAEKAGELKGSLTMMIFSDSPCSAGDERNSTNLLAWAGGLHHNPHHKSER